MKKIIVTGVILLILAVAWIWGGNYSRPDIPTDANTKIATESPEATAESSPIPIETPEASPSASPSLETASPSPTAKSTATPTPSQPKQEIIPSTGKDKYQTDPVPEGKPLPIEPENVTIGSTANTCTLSVRCDTLVNNSKLDKEKVELVPADGVIFETTTVTFYEGESVFNVLQREMKRNKIHMAFRNTPIYNSAYIESINNLYEFDGGDLSGWMYKVNGWFPNYGCSRYQLKPGDVIEWVYTCDLGRDVGGFYATGGGS